MLDEITTLDKIYIGIVSVLVLGVLIYLFVMMMRKSKPERAKTINEMIEKVPYVTKSAALKSNVEIKNKKPEVESYKPLSRTSRFSIVRVKNWFYMRYRLHKVVLINMQLMNGNHRTFLAIEKDGSFTYNEKEYVLDDNLKYYNLDDRMYCYTYHENLSVPVAININVADIRKKLADASDAASVEMVTNPLTLKQFITSKIAEGVMRGQQLDEWMRTIKVLSFIILVIVIVHLVVFMQKSGMLSSISLPWS